MEKRPLTPADYTQRRFHTGGALVFCSAVVVQLLQLPPPQLTTNLRVALWAATVAIPPLVGLFNIYAAAESMKISHETRYHSLMDWVSKAATFICTLSIFWHFSTKVALVFVAVSVIVTWCVIRDVTYQIWQQPISKLEEPKSTQERGEIPIELYTEPNLWKNALLALLTVAALFGVLLLVQFIAQRYL